MKDFDLELIKQGHPIQMRDGRPLTLIEINEVAFYAAVITIPHLYGFFADTGSEIKNGNGMVLNVAQI